MPLISLARDARVTAIWLCVLFGGLGAEVFSIAVVWHLVDSLGSAGAYYLVPQLAAATLSGLLGVGLADRFAPLRVTLFAEMVRVVAALIAFVGVVADWSAWILVAQGVIVSMVRPYHGAGVMAGLSRLGLSQPTVCAASSLVDNTFRVSKILGPALASGLSLLLDARIVLFAAAALFGWALVLFIRLERHTTTGVGEPEPSHPVRVGMCAALVRSIELVRSSRLTYAFASQAVNAGAWYLGLVYAVALMLASDTDAEAGLGSFGFITLCYGLGNVAAGLIVATRPIADPSRFLVAGRALAGVGYLLLAVNHGVWWLAIFAAVTATGTPLADLAFIKQIQAGYRWEDVSRLYLFKRISEYAGMLVAITCSPVLIAWFGVAGTIAVCGVAMICTALVGVIGLLRSDANS